MNKQVDTGDIIRVERFPVYPSDNVETLTRTYDHQLCLFYDIIEEYIVQTIAKKHRNVGKNTILAQRVQRTKCHNPRHG